MTRTHLGVIASVLLALEPVGAEPTRERLNAPKLDIERVEDAPQPSADTRRAREIDRYTVDWVREQIPSSRPGRTARRVPSQGLPFLPPSNLIEMEPVWRRAGHNDWVVLGRGHYTLGDVARQLGDPRVLREESPGIYLLSRPLYVAPTGSLSVSAGETLRLSAHHGAILVSNGDVVFSDAAIVAWDEAAARVLERPVVEKSKARLWSGSKPRPYLLFQNGSRTWIGNSELRGLGYMGGYGSYGLSVSATLTSKSLNRYLKRLPRPRAWIVGSRIEDLFFGIYSNRAAELVIVGNIFQDNEIYGIDPHDHSRNVLIARNLSRGTRHSHGIIISRDVSDADIVENLSVGNAGSGIVLDRQSRGVRVVRNLVLSNGGDGLALFESGDTLVQGNRAHLNRRNGIFSRNSESVAIRSNHAGRNGDDGIEVTAQALKSGSRNLRLDPYEASGSASIAGNHLEDNARSAISAKGTVEVLIGPNDYVNSSPAYFGGSLKAATSTILTQSPETPGTWLRISKPTDSDS